MHELETIRVKVLRSFDLLSAILKRTPAIRRVGRIRSLESHAVNVSGLSDLACVGHRVIVDGPGEKHGHVISVAADNVRLLMDGGPEGLRIGQSVKLEGPFNLYPDASWLGRVIDGEGNPLDGRPLIQGELGTLLDGAPPPATTRRPLGSRLSTGYAIFNTLLPIVRGQRLGIFSGSGVGKSSLLAAFARDLEADVVVIGLIGERGREVSHFVDRVLGKKGLERSVVVASTSDTSALARRQAAFSALSVAEHFRDQGQHVLLMIDSVTRLAEAHREIATASGEPTNMRGFPPSMINLLSGFAERAGPGANGQGDITGIFSVLVQGSDMEEPVADTLRGLLDGHIVLSRPIAERGRFPAVDVLQSVSRSLPDAASESENQMILEARRMLSIFEESEIMVRSGLYQTGANPVLDLAVSLQPSLDGFVSERVGSIEDAFQRLKLVLNQEERQPASG